MVAENVMRVMFGASSLKGAVIARAKAGVHNGNVTANELRLIAALLDQAMEDVTRVNSPQEVV